MAGVFRKAMIWLGLAPDEEYDDYGYGDPMRQTGRVGPPQAPGMPPGYGPGPVGRAPGMHDANSPAADEVEGVSLRPRPVGRPGGSVRPLPQRGPAPTARREDTPTVRPMRATAARPKTVTPDSFDDAKSVADLFKASQPVVMDLGGADRDLARRLIDFSSGMCYALGGNMERVSPGSYLLSPAGVEVSAEERRRLRGEH